MEQISNWRCIANTEFSVDNASPIVAVGTGILDPIKGSVDKPELNLKAICPYFNGTFITGDWKIFVEQYDIEQIAEVSIDVDVNGCAYAKDKEGNGHLYMTTSDGQVFYSNEMGNFTKIGKINTSLNGVKYCHSLSADVFIFYGEDMIAVIPVDTCKINPSKFVYFRDEANFIHVDLYQNNYDIYGSLSRYFVVALDDSNDIVFINFDFDGKYTTGKSEFRCIKIDFLNIVRNIIEETSTNFMEPGVSDIDFPTELKINNIMHYSNTLYLLCDKGYIGSMLICELIDELYPYYNKKSDEFDISSLSLIKFTHTNWHDMIYYDGYFISVGEGPVQESFCKISNLNEIIHKYDILHNMSCTKDYKDMCYLANYGKVNEYDEIDYNDMVLSNRFTFEIDENHRPWINISNLITQTKLSASELCDFINNKAYISIMPLYVRSTSVYDNTITAEVFTTDSCTDPQVRLIMPNMKADYFDARVSISIATKEGL